jgi:hypothetical protein
MVRSQAPSPATWFKALVLVLLGLPAVAGAQIIDEEEVGRFTLGGYVGFAGANMGRFNENIDVVNYFLSNQGIPLREADGLNGGASGRAELRYKLSDRWMVGFGVASTEAMSRFTVTLGAVDFYARSTQFIPAVYYNFPFVQNSEKFAAVADRMNMYVGAAPIFFTAGKAHMRITDNSNEPVFNIDGDLGELDGEGDATGTGIGVQGLFGVSYQLTSAISVAGELGYRIGKISDLEIVKAEGDVRDDTEDDENRREPGDKAITDFFKRPDERNGIPTQDIEGNHIPYYSDHPTPLDLDFSGFLIHIGMRLHLF